ncbi:hypothetical protein [Polyangium aurulentum]|uniref:hypothetical protein n=1 Tax=Polyangium aurulentum TaxID=2567896 RepID=UPI0010AECDFF|nr:hypothetical protein [Polyangium aurulentum]UQA55012.1 hypothetical protein E8A73_027060 [Polyangium aurulentum]
MKITTTTGALLFLIGTGLLTGCTETIDSKNLRTQGIAATIRATATSDMETTLRATLRAGGDESNTYVALGGGDRIFAMGGDKRVEMEAQSTGVYEAEFATGAADTPFKVDLQREGDDSAPNSAGTLPAPFSVTPLGTEPISRGSDLVIAWTPADDGDAMRIHLDGNCIFFENIDVPGDTGKHTIAADSLRPTNSMMPESCDVNVEITRSRTGKADTTFDSESSFVLEQVRRTSFTSAP